MLLVFAPSDQDPRYAATRLEAQAAACQIQDRDLVIAWLPLGGPSHLGDRPLAADAQQRLRERYRIGTDDFVVVLIGKDGTVETVHVGNTREVRETLQREIEQLLDEKLLTK